MKACGTVHISTGEVLTRASVEGMRSGPWNPFYRLLISAHFNTWASLYRLSCISGQLRFLRGGLESDHVQTLRRTELTFYLLTIYVPY